MYFIFGNLFFSVLHVVCSYVCLSFFVVFVVFFVVFMGHMLPEINLIWFDLILIGSRQCAFHRAIDESYALPLMPPNGGSKRELLHLALPFISSLQAIVDTSNLVCWLNIASHNLQMTSRPWNRRGHVMWPISNFYPPPHPPKTYLWNGLN